MKCKECETESPDTGEELVEWIHEQTTRRFVDEFVYGSAFQCAACGSRLDPTKCVILWE